MEETNSREDLHVNLVKQGSFRTSGSLKATSSGRSTPRSSPSFRRLRTPRKGFKGSWGRFQWCPVNRLVFLLVLITVWTYIVFYVQSKWAHYERNKPEFVGYKSLVGNLQNVLDVNRTVYTLVNNTTNSSRLGSVILKENGDPTPENFGVNLLSTRKPGFSHTYVLPTKKHNRSEHRLRNNSHVPANVASVDDSAININTVEARRNTSFGLLVGPFGKTEESVLDWSFDRRKVFCNKKGEFGQLVYSKRFFLVMHELSMTGAPLSMMELATEIMSCGGSVAVIVLSRRGGLMGELIRRKIKVLKDKGERSYKIARRANLIIAGSAVCSTWIGTLVINLHIGNEAIEFKNFYISRFAAESNKILWWIMENRREYFDRSKHLLNQVKMLTFLSDLQSKQWLTWCEEEDIKLKSKPTTVSLSVNDELAFVAGIPCSINRPSFTVEKMQEKKKLLRFAVRQEMGLSDTDMLVISLSSINPGKGQLLLLESLYLVAEKNLPLSYSKINNLIQDGNLSNTSMQDKMQHQETMSSTLTDDKDVLLQTNSNINYAHKKSKRKHSSIPIVSNNDSKEANQYSDAGKQRNLLSDSENTTEPTLKVLIGSVGSKSNKVMYVKELLQFLSQHPKLLKSFLWTPSTTHVSSLYAAADVYVINAQGIGETFGRVTIEAMAFGLPVLGTDAGGTREIVEDKVTGLLHPIGREGILPLARNLQILLSNQTLREQLGNNGRLKVEKMYLKQHMYKQMADVFMQCMKAK